MYCKGCGKEIPEGSSFCQFCGVQLTSIKENENSGESLTSTKSVATFLKKRENLPIVILSALLIVLLGLSIFLLIQKNAQSENTSALNKTIESLNKTINTKQDKIDELQGDVDALQGDVDALQDNVNALQKKLNNYDNTFNVINNYSLYSNKGYALNNFRADKDVIIVHKGSTASFTLTAYTPSGVTISKSVADPSIAEVNFNNSSWRTSVGMTVIGSSEGATTVTFSNSAGSATFKMLIIVV